MSMFSVPVVRVGPYIKHENADSLSITQVLGCPVIFKTGTYNEGDLAIYVPVDSIVDTTVPELSFLQTSDKTRVRIKAKKLRGVFSMGLLIPAPAGGAAIYSIYFGLNQIYSIPIAQAKAIAIVMFSSSIIMIIIAGTISYIIMAKRTKA